MGVSLSDTRELCVIKGVEKAARAKGDLLGIELL